MSNPSRLLFRGQTYPSVRACIAQARVSCHTVKREAVWLGPEPRRPETHINAAGRILSAARKIRAQAEAQALEGAGTTVELAARRMALVKALHNYRKRYGQGVIDAALR
jgi:hypothetical protein